MTIDRVLHAFESGKMDFYSSSFFAEMADAPFLYKEGAVIGYGKEGDEYVAINFTRARAGIENWNLGPTDEEGNFILDAETYAPYRINRPLVPPSKVQVSEVEYAHETTYLDHWLHFYDGCSPKYINPDSEKHALPTTIDSTWEALVVDPDNPNVLGYQFDFNYPTIHVDVTLPICNGFACFPKIVNRRLFVTLGRRYVKQDNTVVDEIKYYKDPSKRNRGMVLMDFDSQGGCSFLKMTDCKRSLNGEVTIPGGRFNPRTQSLIVVLKGRILTPRSYTVVGNVVLLSKRAISPASLIDERICEGALLATNTVLEGTVDIWSLMKDDNSFFVIVNKPNLQIVVHPKWWTTSEPIKPNPRITTNTYASSHRIQFDRLARGLLVDQVTDSVYDYAREEHTVTFYADVSEPIHWRTSTVTVRPELPIVQLKSSKDNFMSARGMLFTKPTDIAKEDVVLWPNYVIYDFIFRG